MPVTSATDARVKAAELPLQQCRRKSTEEETVGGMVHRKFSSEGSMPEATEELQPCLHTL